MNLTARFSMIMKTSVSSLFEVFEDPERSLNQLILDMEDEVEAAKRAAARALANEDRLRNKLRFHEQDAAEWQQAAEAALERSDEGEAREALKRAELAERQSAKIASQLAEQECETQEVRESIASMNDRVTQAKSRLQLLQAKLRHSEARAHVADVMKGVSRRNLQSEFDRISDKLEDQTAEDRAYWRIDDELRGDDLRRRVADSQVDAAVEDRLERMRAAAERKAERPAPKRPKKKRAGAA